MLVPTTAIFDNIAAFIKLTPLREQPNQEKWIRDENDLCEALTVTLEALHDTARMLGHPMYAGEKVFDFAEDTRRALEEMYLSARERSDIIVQRKKHLVMYHLVLAPIIDELGRYDHSTVLASIDDYFSSLHTFLFTNDIEVQIDDAIVTQHICNAKIHERDKNRKNSIKQRKTVKKQAVEDI